MVNPSYYQSFPVTQQMQQTEHVFKLYMYQHVEGLSNGNQKVITSAGYSNHFGTAAALDWVVRDALSPTAKIVAHAQGLAVGADQTTYRYWICQNIMFIDDRFKGSTLKLLGSYVNDEADEWAIVGGSGEFSYAQGAVKYKIMEYNDGTVVRELNIRALCTNIPSNPPIPVHKDVPAMGGGGGDEFDIAEPPRRLESVTIRSGDVIDSFAFSYTDKAGKKQMAGPWGGTGGLPKTIVFGPAETVTKVYGTTDNFGGHVVVTSLTIATNLTTYETLGKGKGSGNLFTLPRKDGQPVTGFFGRAGLFVDALGVYTA